MVSSEFDKLQRPCGVEWVNTLILKRLKLLIYLPQCNFVTILFSNNQRHSRITKTHN